MEKPTVTIFTDGSSNVHDERNPGGAGAVLLTDTHIRVISHWEEGVTNNQMEIVACTLALRALKQSCNVILYSDSEYVVKSMQGFYKKKKNPDWWAALEIEAIKHDIEWRHMRGHGKDQKANSFENRWNTEADWLAGCGREDQLQINVAMPKREYARTGYCKINNPVGVGDLVRFKNPRTIMRSALWGDKVGVWADALRVMKVDANVGYNLHLRVLGTHLSLEIHHDHLHELEVIVPPEAMKGLN